MKKLRACISKWPYSLLSVFAGLSAFGAYTCMYAFRKAFAAGTYNNEHYFHVDYKVWLVIAQILGYTFSKFYGIRFIAEIESEKRGRAILVLVGIAWLALLGFAIIPPPYNIICLFMNGFPLGLIWGLVFGYLEGRRSTEFMAAVLSISLIFASGFIKTAGRTLIATFGVSDFNMPFLTGAVFAIPLLLFVFCLELIPSPNEEDVRLRTKRTTMTADERREFLQRFLPGIILTLVIYVLLTVMRDVRDNFEVEIWASLGIKNNMIFTSTDTKISVIVLVALSLLILIKKNLLAFSVIHLLIIAGCLLIGLSTILFSAKMISPTTWMVTAGLGLYLGYVPYNAIFFERMIATFHYKSNVGFIIYVADSLGYLGSISLLLIKEFAKPNISWAGFFQQGVVFVAVIGGVCATLSLIYFVTSAKKGKGQDVSDSQFNIQPV